MNVLRNIIEAMYLERAHMEGVVGMQVVHLNESNVGHFRDAGVRMDIGGVVPLHIGNHEDGVGFGGGLHHLASFIDRGTHWFLNEHVLAGLGRRNTGSSMRSGRADNDGIDVALHQIMVIAEAPLERDLVLISDGCEQLRGEIGQSTDLEFVRPFAQNGQMLDPGQWPRRQ